VMVSLIVCETESNAWTRYSAKGATRPWFSPSWTPQQLCETVVTAKRTESMGRADVRDQLTIDERGLSSEVCQLDRPWKKSKLTVNSIISGRA
jgi:hypothetical protein